MEPLDVLVVGAGPAGLAAAIRLRQRLAEAGRDDVSVVVIDKAAAPGYHSLSGAVVDPRPLDELLPGWRRERSRLTELLSPVEHDDLYYLTAEAAVRVPDRVVPGPLHHTGDVALSLSRLADHLTAKAEALGAEVYHGFSARALIVEGGIVRGVRLAEVGLDAEGRPKSNHRPAEELRARLTVLADGSRGVLSSELEALVHERRRPQVYSIGVKATLQFPGPHPFGERRAVHTLGYPAPQSVFGGGFIYSLGPKTVTAGIMLGLDWRYGDLDPRAAFEAFRAHPFIERLLERGSVVATGAKTIPEGGYSALGPLAAPGALVVGDASGFVNMERMKGVDYAVRSGMCAAEAIADALLAERLSDAPLVGYRERLEAAGVLGDLHGARNYRQSFRLGLYAGAVLSQVQAHLPDRLPIQLRMPEDRETVRRGARLGRPGMAGPDGAAFVVMTGTKHREDEPVHVGLVDPSRCLGCDDAYGSPCTHFCPGEVYRRGDDGMLLSPSNCLHCMTCTVKCPEGNIRWVPPEGGEGPRFKLM